MCFVEHIKEIYSQKIMASIADKAYRKKMVEGSYTAGIKKKRKPLWKTSVWKLNRRCRCSTDGSPIHYWHTSVTIAADCRLMVDWWLVNTATDTWPILDGYSTNTRPTLRRNIDQYVDRHSTDIQPMLDRYSLYIGRCAGRHPIKATRSVDLIVYMNLWLWH